MSVFIRLVIIVLVLTLGCGHLLAQGTVTFDHPAQTRGTSYLLNEWIEAGVIFTGLYPDSAFIRAASGRPGVPDNGSSYLQGPLGGELSFALLDGQDFNLVSLDLSEYSTVFQEPASILFRAWRSDGSFFERTIVTDGIIDGTGSLPDFQTFTFGPEFSGIRRVDVLSYGWGIDNVFVTVPEPTVWPLLGLCGIVIPFRRAFKRTRCHQ